MVNNGYFIKCIRFFGWMVYYGYNKVYYKDYKKMNKFLKHYFTKKRKHCIKLAVKPVRKSEKSVVKDLTAVEELLKEGKI